jgi:hypothetical protein
LADEGRPRHIERAVDRGCFRPRVVLQDLDHQGVTPHALGYPGHRHRATTPVKMSENVPTITLDALAADPSRIQSLPPHVQADLYLRASRLEAELRAFFLTAPRDHAMQAPQDQALTLREAVDLLRVSRDSLYRRWRSLGFAFKDPLDGRIKFSRRGLERYVERHLKEPASRA